MRSGKVFINVHFNPEKIFEKNPTASPGQYKLHLMRWKDGILLCRNQKSPAIYHLPLHYCAVSPARLLEDFGMVVQTLVVGY